MTSPYFDLDLKNESDVEQKFVYKFLTTPIPNGLGYLESDFRTKLDIKKIAIDKGNKKKLYYPDYAIIIDGLPCMIIEAKAPGEDLNEAIREARLYSTEINASYKNKLNPCSRIIATNGIQIYACHWDEDSPHVELLVSDMNPLNGDFDKLLKFVSKREIANIANEYLKVIKSNADYLKPVFMLGGKSVINETVGVNSFGANVSFEYKYLFNPENQEDREAIVNNAYITSRRKLSHVSPIDKIIRAAIPQNLLDAKVIADTANPIEIIEQINNTKVIRNEVCLLIGGVGAGKSTFTDYLRLIALPDSVRNTTEWININLNLAPVSKDLIYKWIVDKIIQTIKNIHNEIDFDHIDTLNDIYKSGLEKIKKGRASIFKDDTAKYNEILYLELVRFQEDAEYTLKCIINYLYSIHNKLLIIVLDNCDKLNKDEQLLMFEVTTWLKDTFSCMIFLPLRDTTYDQYYNEPPLDTVIKDLVFRIDPPLLEKVVYARLHYAIREIESSDSEFSYYLSNNARVKCSRDEVGVYLKCIIASLFRDNLFKRIITGLAGRNIRKGLEILLDFCRSGHINDDELFKIKSSSGDYVLPSHLVERILMKGNRKYYYDEQSHIKNMFHSDKEESLPDPFVRIAILQWLRDRYREYGPNKVKGFHRVDNLIKILQATGHSKNRILLEIQSLSNAECILAETQSDIICEDDLISIAPGGFIHLDLLRNINYLSNVAEDTYFRENQVAKKISDNLVGRGVYKYMSKQATIDNSLLLVDYMDRYQKDYFLGMAKILSEECNINNIDINSLKEFVEKIAINDKKFSNLKRIENDYPAGTQVCAQVVSVQTYGVFIEFDLNGIGMIHKSQCYLDGINILDDFEEGDWLIAEIIDYSTEHERFTCKIIDK